jgi:cell division septation protein DedD
MENRLKERLTGAAILVALIVLVVPEMFHGQRNESSGPVGGASEGPPIRSYTIDLGGNARRDTPLQAAAPLAPRAAPVMIPAPVAAAEPEPPSTAAPASSVSGASHGEAARAAPAHASVTATGQGHWSVQLGLFAKRDNAERLMDAAQNKGFDVALSGPDVKGHYHVHATGFASRAAAEAWAERLKSAGFSSAVTATAQ